MPGNGGGGTALPLQTLLREEETMANDLPEGDEKHAGEEAKAVLTVGHEEEGRRSPEGRGATEGGGTTEGGTKSDEEGGATGAASMTGGDWRGVASGEGGHSDASPAGGRGGASEHDLGPIGMESAGGGSRGSAGPAAGSGGDGWRGATYNDAGQVVGPDSAAGERADLDARGAGQGDDLANRLGGGEGSGAALSGSGHSGDMEPGRSDADEGSSGGLGGPDAGSPGGMGGVRARGGTENGNPPGGLSPVQADKNRH